jgi:hypothetical protein
MKDIARSRITYYSLAREILMKNHPKIFNSLLILALVFMTGMAVFLISDILSFGSDSSYKGVLAGLNLQEKEKSFLSAYSSKKDGNQGLLVANNSYNASGNLSRANNLSKQNEALGSSNSSRIGNSSQSIQTSGGVVAGDGSSSGSSNKPNNNKKDSTNVAIHHSHSSGSSASSSKSAKEIKSQENLTQARIIGINQTSMNQSGFNSSLAKELEKRNILTSYSVGNNSSSNRANDDSIRDPQIRIDFKTDLTTKSKPENSQNSGEIGAETVPGSDIRSDSKSTAIESRREARRLALAQKNARKPAQTSQVTATSKSQNRLQSTRDQQIANRNKLINERKSQSTQSRAISQRRSRPT